ncbi:hypothetical protein [Azospirillum largimobile]
MHENPFLGSCWKSFCAYRDVRDRHRPTTPNKPIIPWDFPPPAGGADFSGTAKEDGRNRFRRPPATPPCGAVLPLFFPLGVSDRETTPNSEGEKEPKG